MHVRVAEEAEIDQLATLWHDGWSTPWYHFMVQFATLTAFGRAIFARLYRFIELFYQTHVRHSCYLSAPPSSRLDARVPRFAGFQERETEAV